MSDNEFEDTKKVKLIVKVVSNEIEKEDFIKTLHPADIEVKRMKSKIMTVSDFKNEILYAFKKPAEGGLSLSNFYGCQEVTLSKSVHEDLLFYSELAKLIASVNEENETDTQGENNES